MKAAFKYRSTLRLRRGLLAIALMLTSSVCNASLAGSSPLPPFEPQVSDAEPVLRAWQAPPPEAAWVARMGPLRGIAVPHHLPAADLIVLGLRTAAASAPPPRRIVILAPDHFKRSGRPVATSRRDHLTALGPVAVDRAAVTRLLTSPWVEESDLLGREHGIGVLLPFLRLAFPGVPVVPVTLSINSRRVHWDALVQMLLQIGAGDTLIVQSTDFSHYLPLPQAVWHDQRTLHRLAAGDADGLAGLHQPREVDSAGALYVQVQYQRRRYSARPVVLANRNSAETGITDAALTTSYMVKAYAGPASASRVLLPAEPARTVCLAGDTFFGRHVERHLARADVRQRVHAAWRERLGGCPLVVNLEGVLLDDPRPFAAAGRDSVPRLAMARTLALRELAELNVVAAGTANNHALDFGPDARERMTEALRQAGIVVLEDGVPQTVGGLTLLALADFDNPPRGGAALIDAAALERVRAAADDAAAQGLPLAAFLHWGREFRPGPGRRESELAERLAEAGARWVVGAHPHMASTGLQALRNGRTLLAHSLGNFVFDQKAPRASGAVLQISCFAQGSCASRWIPMPGLYELADR